MSFRVVAFSEDRVCGQQIHPQSALILEVAGLLHSQRNHPVPCRTLLLASFGRGVFVFGGLRWMGHGLLCKHQLDNLLVGS